MVLGRAGNDGALNRLGKVSFDDGMTSSFSAFVDKDGAGMGNTDYARPTIFASG